LTKPLLLSIVAATFARWDMLIKTSAENWKSIKNAELNIDALTVLIGIVAERRLET
jgi:hypothetical protein